MKNKFFRKAVAVLLSIAMLVPMIPAAFAAQPSDFTDFPTGWSNEAMTAAVANGLLNGRTATTIEPQGNLTRAEMATIINRAFGAVKTADISQFHDVSASDWFYTEIAKAVNMQTFQGDGTGTMRPNSLITREEVFAVVARSLVLETSDFSALNSHPDGYNVADWAKPYASILSQKKYINGDSYGNLNPKSYITREEFAQIMHNIIKTYYTTPAMFNHSGASSSLIRTSGVTLSDVTINGDLIIGDGVGAGTVVLKNVIIKGRLLARGGEGSVTLTNTTVGEGVVVKDVNGIVHFNNYRTEAPFVGIREITKATFKNRTGSGSGVTTHSVTINGAGYDNKTYSVQSGKNFTFPGPNGAGHDAFAGWVLSTDFENKKVYEQGKTYKIEGNVTFVPVYYYNVEHWYIKLEGNSAAYNEDNYVKSDGATETLVGKAGSDPTINYKVIKGFFYIDETKNSEKITESGLVVKVYYDRLDVYIDYVLSDGKFRAEYTPVTKVKFGKTITLPSIGNMENSTELKRWRSNPSIGGINEFAPGSAFVVNDYDVSTGKARITLVAIWEDTKYYTVQFIKEVDVVETVTVPENGTVDIDDYNELLKLWEREGYKENEYISSSLYKDEPFTHKIYANWYYRSNGDATPYKWEKFDSNVKITDDIADENDVVKVLMKFPTITLTANLPKIFSKPYPRPYYYEEEGLTVGENGNPQKTGTRAADTIKDFLWDWFAPGNRTLDSNEQLYAYIEKAGDKAFGKLREKGLLDDNNKILDQSLTVKFASFIDRDLNKANIRKFIIDKAKESLGNNQTIFDYFETMAQSSDPADKDKLKELLGDAIKDMIATDSAASDMVKDICDEMLNDSEIVKKALENYVNYEVDVSDDDLGKPAKDSITKWTKELIEKDPEFQKKVRDELVDYIIDELRNNDDFFDDIVAYNFNGTPFANITKPVAGETTTNIVIDIVKNEFEKMEPDELAKELGYDDLHDLFVKRKGDILDVLIEDLDDEAFFAHVVSTTDFKNYTLEYVKKSSSKSIILEYIESEIEGMSDGELAEFAGYATKDDMLKDAKEKIAKALVEDIKVNSDGAYDTVVEKLTGKKADEIEDNITSIKLFKLILIKAVDDAKVDPKRDYTELSKLTGKDFESMSEPEIDEFFANFESSLAIDNILDEYLMIASYGKYTLDKTANPSAEELPSDTKEMIAALVELRFENDFDSIFETLGYTDDDIIEQAKEYAKEQAKEKVYDSNDSFLVEQIKEHVGIEYPSYGAIPVKAFDLVVDVIKDKVNKADNIDDTFANEIGYNNQKELFDEIKQLLIDDTVDKIERDKSERDKYIRRYSKLEFKDGIEDNAMDFIVQYALAILNPMSYDDIKEELEKLGYGDDVLDSHIESYISENLEEIVSEEFGYCPDNIENLNTKQFITELVVYVFDTDDKKREQLVDEAVGYLVDKGKLDGYEDDVNKAINSLRESGKFDNVVDEIIEKDYKVTIDKLVNQLVDEEQFTIEPDVKFVLEAIDDMIDDYSYDAIKAQIEQFMVDKGAPDSLIEKIFKIYPEDKLKGIYNDAYMPIKSQIDSGLNVDIPAGKPARIKTGMTFNINPVRDIYVPLYDTNIDRFKEKAENVFYYSRNPYLKELVSLTSPDTFFNGNDIDGYSLKSYSDYYDLMLRLAIIGDDAINWYTENLTEQQLDELVRNYEDFFVEKANMLADMLETYADTGDIPDKIDNNIVSAIEKKLTEKFASQLDGVLEWYKTSRFNKAYGSGDYEYIRKAVNKAFNGIDITTHEVFDLLSKLCDKASGKYDDLDGIHDKIVKIGANTYEVTINGKTLTITRINDNEFKVEFEGKAAKLLRKFDDGKDNYCEIYQIHFGGNYIELKRAIVGSVLK